MTDHDEAYMRELEEVWKWASAPVSELVKESSPRPAPKIKWTLMAERLREAGVIE